MGIITLTCKQCGGQVNLDGSKEFGYCSMCGTKLIIQQEIYKTEISNNLNLTQTIIKNIYGREKDELEDLLLRAAALVQINEDGHAKKLYKEATEQFPERWEAWFARAKYHLDYYLGFGPKDDGFYSVFLNRYGDEADKIRTDILCAFSLGDEKAKKQITETFVNFFDIAWTDIKFMGVEDKICKPYEYLGIRLEVNWVEETCTILDKLSCPDKKEQLLRHFEEAEAVEQEKKRKADSGIVDIPYGKTSVENNAFRENKVITSVTIPDSVTTIGDFAFDSCYNLTNIVIPNTISSIGKNAFSRCAKLSNILIPDSVTTIGDFAFQNCIALSSITIPDSVTSIGCLAFSMLEKNQIIYVNKMNSKRWDKKWDKGCKAKIIYR